MKSGEIRPAVRTGSAVADANLKNLARDPAATGRASAYSETPVDGNQPVAPVVAQLTDSTPLRRLFARKRPRLIVLAARGTSRFGPGSTAHRQQVDTYIVSGWRVAN